MSRRRRRRLGPWLGHPSFTVVGVVGDVCVGGVIAEVGPMVYLSLDQFWEVDSLRVVLRTADESDAIAGTLQTVMSEIDRTTPAARSKPTSRDSSRRSPARGLPPI